MDERAASQIITLGIFDVRRGLQDHDKSLAVLRLDDLSSKKITPGFTDYDKLKDLVKACEDNHNESCRAKSLLNVSGLKLIDTKTQEVIDAPDHCGYVALSYVWGHQEDDSSVDDLRSFPPVIRDAISVTNSMGYQYLWVDRYCISQHHSEEKYRMIGQMHRIYANASITIIAAAGTDAQMGLPGVSNVPRRPQQHVRVHDIAILQIPLGRDELNSSAWASRGWTYQECYLSTRRLIFTPTQVLFLCNETYVEESAQHLMNNTCYGRPDIFGNLIPMTTFLEIGLPAGDLRGHIQEYSKRKLSYSSDSLNAFLGVLNSYEHKTAKSTSPLLHLSWGLVAEKVPEGSAFEAHLFWHHEIPAIRRVELPSWAWTGWEGRVEFDLSEITLEAEHEAEANALSYLDWKISLEDEGCGAESMYDVARNRMMEARKGEQRLYRPGPKRLRISCLTVPVHFQELNLTEDQRERRAKLSVRDTGESVSVSRHLHGVGGGVHPFLQIWKGIYVGAFSYMDREAKQGNRVLGLLFDGCRGSKEIRCLLVRQAGDGLFERVGLILTLSLQLRGWEWRTFLSSKVFSDAAGNLLDEVTISDEQAMYPFADTAERRTICLV